MKIQKSFRIDKDLWAELERISELEDRSCSMQIVHFIRQGVDAWRSGRKNLTKPQESEHPVRTGGPADKDR
ncbi:hypothetical protein [Desulfobotulus sp.]|uniref:hypothetical protein n=1 Tax=Desulfobotulus sp. TaxID=1940337 RepID=UPI002A36CC7C|nr:hypothetical protein [Desulfobotulus sp.]MDY0164321.1 hypothetical protein [Desulfobotulus sp.]